MSDSRHVPLMPFFLPLGIAVAVPFGRNVICTFFPEGVVAENGFPVANMVWISEGGRCSAAKIARGHWGVESMHWLLDVEFGDDLSRYRAGYGARNMAIIRRFALGLVRANKTKGSVKTRRKTAGWSPEFLLQILQLKER